MYNPEQSDNVGIPLSAISKIVEDTMRAMNDDGSLSSGVDDDLMCGVRIDALIEYRENVLGQTTENFGAVLQDNTYVNLRHVLAHMINIGEHSARKLAATTDFSNMGISQESVPLAVERGFKASRELRENGFAERAMQHEIVLARRVEIARANLEHGGEPEVTAPTVEDHRPPQKHQK